ncbi:hypothetical protein LDK25_07005 [Fusobacterium nucleatum]|uniref:hypothetical protein n=1 Tax=Fusobacterium nucleatum TaxID=851 RepID=UPI0030EEACEE
MKKIKVLFMVIFTLLFISCSKDIKEIVEISTSPYSNNVMLTIMNKSEKDTIEIVWDKSKIGDSGCFLKGKYIDAGKPQLNEILAPNELKIISIYPSDNVYFDEGKIQNPLLGGGRTGQGWKIKDIHYPTKLVLCLKVEDKEEFIITDISK